MAPAMGTSYIDMRWSGEREESSVMPKCLHRQCGKTLVDWSFHNLLVMAFRKLGFVRINGYMPRNAVGDEILQYLLQPLDEKPVFQVDMQYAVPYEYWACTAER